jgi:hypothetical protein
MLFDGAVQNQHNDKCISYSVSDALNNKLHYFSNKNTAIKAVYFGMVHFTITVD